MNGKKTNLMNDKNLKKKIVVIGIVFFIISVGFNIYLDTLGYFFPRKDIVEIDEEEPEEKPDISPTHETVEKIVNQIEENLIKSYITELTKYGAHPTATRLKTFISKILGKLYDLPIEKVADFIYTELQDMDIKVKKMPWKQEFKIGKLLDPAYRPFRFFLGNNIEATLPGTNGSSDEIYILVSHYDTYYRSPGANDGSSGVAAVLTAAKLMSQYSFEHTVRFLFVAGEKQMYMGSREYVKVVKENKDNIVAVFNVDAIGNPGPDYRGDEIVITFKDPCWVADYLKDVNGRYHNSLNFVIFDGCTGDHYCDHKTFLNNGYDVVCVCEANFDENWLRPSDTIENVDMVYATKVTKLVIATICELALDLR